MSEFERFGLAGTDPTWSSAALEAAVERAMADGSPDEMIRGVHGLLARPDLSSAHASFVGDFVKTLLLKLGPELAGCDLGWLPGAIGSPAQALLAVSLLPDDRFDPELVLAVLSQLESTAELERAVLQLQDVAARPDVARHLAAARPDLAARVRNALAH